MIIFVANVRRAPPHAVGRGSFSPTPHQVWRLRLRNTVATAFDPRGVRCARASPRGEPADGPRSTRALADFAWLSSRSMRNALHLTPLAEARPHRHCARSAAAALTCGNHRFRAPWCAPRARFAPWRTGRRPTEHAPWCDTANPLHVNVVSATATADFQSTRTSRAQTKALSDGSGLGLISVSWVGVSLPGPPGVHFCPSEGVRMPVAWCRGASSPREHSSSVEKSDNSVIYGPFGVMFRRGYLLTRDT